MPNNRLIHDAAWSIATSLLELMSPLSAEERKERFDALYTTVKDGIERYENAVERMEKQLRPTRTKT
jgi:hypothetical protein